LRIKKLFTILKAHCFYSAVAGAMAGGRKGGGMAGRWNPQPDPCANLPPPTTDRENGRRAGRTLKKP